MVDDRNVAVDHDRILMHFPEQRDIHLQPRLIKLPPCSATLFIHSTAPIANLAPFSDFSSTVILLDLSRNHRLVAGVRLRLRKRGGFK